MKEIHDKFDPGRRMRTLRRFGLKDLTWPLEREAVNECVKDLAKFRSEASLCLQIDQR